MRQWRFDLPRRRMWLPWPDAEAGAADDAQVALNLYRNYDEGFAVASPHGHYEFGITDWHQVVESAQAALDALNIRLVEA